jgi:hypothetical protein
VLSSLWYSDVGNTVAGVDGMDVLLLGQPGVFERHAGGFLLMEVRKA